MSNIFDNKFGGLILGIALASIILVASGFTPLGVAMSNSIISILFYIIGRLDGNGSSS